MQTDADLLSYWCLPVFVEYGADVVVQIINPFAIDNHRAVGLPNCGFDQQMIKLCHGMAPWKGVSSETDRY